MTHQLPLPLPLTEGFAREDFFASPVNAAALAATATAQRLLLVGPDGAGKTHLAHIWAGTHAADLIAAADLPAALPGLPRDARIAIDNADAADQTALFHLYNLLTPAGCLLLTAATPPRDWANLPDLLSRLQTLPTAQLAPPDDALLAAVLVKLFADRQIAVPPALIAWLTSRMERSIAAARSLVAALDARSLATSRPITRALAAELLDSQPPPPLD